MAYNEHLAQVIRDNTGNIPGVVEKKIFGGIVFFINGNMSVGIHKDNLIIRINPKDHDDALQKPFTKAFDLTGRPMKGWIMLLPKGQNDPQLLDEWIQKGISFAASLPQK